MHKQVQELWVVTALGQVVLCSPGWLSSLRSSCLRPRVQTYANISGWFEIQIRISKLLWGPLQKQWTTYPYLGEVLVQYPAGRHWNVSINVNLFTMKVNKIEKGPSYSCYPYLIGCKIIVLFRPGLLFVLEFYLRDHRPTRGFIRSIWSSHVT